MCRFRNSNWNMGRQLERNPYTFLSKHIPSQLLMNLALQLTNKVCAAEQMANIGTVTKLYCYYIVVPLWS